MVSSYDSQVLKLTNQARARHGLRPLMHGSCIDRKAETWSRTMAARNMFRHQSAWGILRACHRRTAGENIAMSRRSHHDPRRIVRMDELRRAPRQHPEQALPDHGPRLDVGGLGRIYVAQTFGG